MTAAPVAVVGVGLMGSRMARRLLGAGHRVRGFDPDPARLDELERDGGTPTGSVEEAIAGAWCVLLSLPNSDVSREVCLGEGGVAAAGGEGLLVLDSTTGRPEDAREIAEGLGRRRIDYADATVSGNAPYAERGELVVMVGGSRSAYERGRPVFEAIGRSHHHVGPVGAGSTMKLVVNHVLGVNRLAVAEGLVVAELAGLDLAAVLGVLRDSLAFSRAMDAYGDRMAAGDHLPPSARIRQSHKDARIIVEHGSALGAPMDLAMVSRDVLAEAEREGLADHDNSAVAEVVRRRAGIGRVPREGR